MAKTKKIPENKYGHLYVKADKIVILNEGDPDLDEIRVQLPKPPPLHEIQGYGLPPSKQKWEIPEMPKKLAELNAKRFEDVEMYWQELSDNYQYYKDELPFIKEHWERRRNGYWLFINGKPTWLPPWHYWYLTAFEMDNEKGIKFADYRDRDRKFFVGCHYAASTTDAYFKYKIHQPDGTLKYTSSPKALEAALQKAWTVERGGYLVDMKKRTVIGLNYPKLRREGATTKTQAINLEIITRMPDANSGIQSMTEKHADTVYQQFLLRGWRGLPFYFIPINEKLLNPVKHLRMQPKGKGNAENTDGMTLQALYSSVTPGSGTEKFFDTWKLKFYHADEVGKCLGYNTPVLMGDGTTKPVQEVKVFDEIMGVNGQRRLVLSTTSGRDTMYRITPKSGDSWECNESHILSLKWCMSRWKLWGRYKKGDVVNMPITTYLNLSKTVQNHLMLYKAPTEFKERKHKISPYIMGVWLGDGNSHTSAITNIDKEVIAEIYKYTKANGLNVYMDGDITYRISNKYGNNILLSELRRLNLIANKHIPQSFLQDSRKNRLQLLAGLIDSDGHKFRSGYEIIQKKKSITDGVISLARSLGFGVNCTTKKATMRRNDGSIYSSTVYRITIFGTDLSVIPCRVKRKKFDKVTKHINGRNPLHKGFKVEQIGEGDYYGFTIDGDRLFLLGDYTVTHNTEDTDVYERHYIVKKTMTLGSDANVVGFGLNTSTVEDMEKGGSEFQRLCKESHWRDRNDVGQTMSGYMNFFIPSDEGLEGFIDEFGNSRREEARTHIMAIRQMYEDQGKTEELIKEIRKSPLTFRECFTFVAKNKKFDMMKINRRLSQFAFVDQNPAVVRGTLEWAGWDKITKYDLDKLPTIEDVARKKVYVRFVPAHEGSTDWDWEFSYLPEKEANGFFYSAADNTIIPANRGLFRFGVDMFKYAEQTQDGRGSLGAGAIYRNFNPSVDNPLLTQQEGHIIDPKTGDTVWQTDRFCGVYMKRPDDKNEFLEQMLMAAVFFGVPAFPEINVPDVWDWISRDRRFYGYLLHRVDRVTGRVDHRPGANTGPAIKNQIFNSWADYIKKNAEREHHLVFLTQCKDIMDDMRDFDAFVAGGYALIQEQETFFGERPDEDEQGVDLSNVVRTYSV